MRKALTKKQAKVLQFLKDYREANSYMPTSREISEAFGFASQTAAMGYLNVLEKKGYIRRKPNAARAITIIEVEDAPVAAGTPSKGQK